MKIKVVVLDLELSKSFKRAAASVVSAGVLLLGFGSTVDAAPPGFTAGEPLSASKMNASFAEVDGRIARIEARIGTDRQYAQNAIYVKATVPTPGDLTGLGVERGYAGARKACQQKTGSQTAHVCTNEEVVRSLSLGIAVPVGKFANGSDYYSDCQAFSNATGIGARVYFTTSSPPYITTSGCSTPEPLLCCDAAP